ncbi:MAG: nucleotidyltransferase domain-containing protein [Spirochaetia bacterium]|nr:nucleotidyltransferase domain-containing protein [Spirochaetia bacterium]
MEKSQYDLVVEILRRFNEKGILGDMVLIGSWATVFYEKYFNAPQYSASIKTRDIDFALPRRIPARENVDIPELLYDMGFIVKYFGDNGLMKLDHPGLILEFIVPEAGAGSELPYRIKQLGINAQPLRYMNMLTENTITIDFEGMNMMLPHPVVYALHKFIIFKRRKKQEKSDKDPESALKVFN